MDKAPPSLAAALTEAARTLNASRSVGESLDAIVKAARRAVPGFDHVGVSLKHRDGTIETMAGTDQLVWELDALQCELGQGPCVDAIESSAVVVVEHVQHEQRWPAYIPQAVDLGVRAQLGLRLYTEQGTLGGINLYSTDNETVEEGAVEMAELFAAHAAIALGRSRYEHDLNQALVARKVIGEAIGILMERYGIDDDRAFHFLVRASSTSNIKLRAVAQELVDTTNERNRSTSAM